MKILEASRQQMVLDGFVAETPRRMMASVLLVALSFASVGARAAPVETRLASPTTSNGPAATAAGSDVPATRMPGEASTSTQASAQPRGDAGLIAAKAGAGILGGIGGGVVGTLGVGLLGLGIGVGLAALQSSAMSAQERERIGPNAEMGAGVIVVGLCTGVGALVGLLAGVPTGAVLAANAVE